MKMLRALSSLVGCMSMALVATFTVALAPVSAFAAGDANTPACPNETAVGFRPGLPDCRSYEMVSPPYKDGFSIQGVQTFSEGSVNGAPLLSASSLGAFAGGPDITSIGNDYLFRRSPTSWETFASDPQPESFNVNPQVGPSDEHGHLAVSEEGASLFSLHSPSESAYASNLYIRTLDGSLTEIGPMLAPENEPSAPTGQKYLTDGLHYAGANSDLSHVLFYIAAGEELPVGFSTNLWSGDSTVGAAAASSLYEYVGTGHSGLSGDAPKLVGLDSEGHLLSQCGIALGGPPARVGNTRNAISADGETLFLTALKGGCKGLNRSGEPVTGTGPLSDQLYERVGGALTDLSIPTAECGAPCEGLPAANASFEGGSSDGATGVFTSTEKLLPEASEDEAGQDDAVENGGCPAAKAGAGCNLYGYDRSAPSGHKLFLISGGAATAQVQGVAAISNDASHVYFVSKAKLTGANGAGQEPTEGGENLFLYTRVCEGGGSGCASPTVHTTFIATLSEENDLFEWSQTAEEPMNVTPDGQFLLFTSTEQLTPDDTSTVRQVFRYDAGTGSLVRISIGNEGFNNNGNTEVYGANVIAPFLHGVQEPGIDIHPSISDNGQVVVFQSPTGLTPGALNGRSQLGPFEEIVPAKNVYEYENGHVYLISDGTTAFGVPLQFLGALLTGVSPSGEDIMFRTYGPVLPQDSDSLVDIYDARRDGGFPAPAGGRTECGGSACQTPIASNPALPSVGSLSQDAGENLKPSTTTTVTPRQTVAQKLTAALRKCKKMKVKRNRLVCERQARKKYSIQHRATRKKARSKKK